MPSPAGQTLMSVPAFLALEPVIDLAATSRTSPPSFARRGRAAAASRSLAPRIRPSRPSSTLPFARRPMPATILLGPHRPITLESALRKDENIIGEAANAAAAADFSKTLWANRHTISGLKWIQGNFNICILVQLCSGTPRFAYTSALADEQTLIFRCAIPHKIAQGAVDEKLSCEVGTHAWMESQCPEVRIPHLYGFGFSNHRHYTHEERMPFYVRLWRTIRRYLHSLLGFPGFLSYYTAHPASHLRLPAAYTLLEFIGPDTGRAPQAINETFTCVEPFVTDLLNLHDGYFLTNQNAVRDAKDCRYQMADLTLLRALSHHFVGGKSRRRNGPFHLQLTDIHQSNVFVDDDWNVTCLIDLEWVCALPAEMLAVPHWLTGLGIDELMGDDLVEFNSVRQQFLRALEEVEEEMLRISGLSKEGGAVTLSSTIRDSWESGAVWFWHCLDSVNAMSTLVEYHVARPFSYVSAGPVEVLHKYWCQSSDKVVDKKVADRETFTSERVNDELGADTY
ncbi:hypothetical protein B0T16DRAFT_450972 [Cercophora newfieldiana]|uniref:Aminoglycoside phosphotransferase domain-containing protein n=1 Tax=Cercophora newfieldiana TaxID=92897 RepID=A0AA39YMN2_9PEZI|nr:hypothetical protein B0T16DRAFT_450972 [Cercophora newfieldiana]